MKKIKIFGLGTILSSLLILWSCNTDYPNLLKAEYGDDTVGKSVVAKKVLYVIIDGVNGDVLKAVAPTNIANYGNNAVYSYETLTDNNNYVSNELTGWTTLLTGRNPIHHGVYGSNTQPDFVSSPTIFNILNNKNTVLYTASEEFASLFGSEADQSFALASDENVKNDVVQSLVSTSNDLTVVNFVGVDEAGLDGGYTEANASYVQAIQTIDGYVKELVDAVKSRDSYAKEDWLVILTSNRGTVYGESSAENNYFLISEKNNFIVFYNPKLVSRYYARPGTEIPFDRGVLKFTMNPVADATKAVMADPSQFNMNFPAQGVGYTMQFKIKYTGNGGSSWPEIISKAVNADNAAGGFVFFSSSTTGGFQYRVGTSGARSVGTAVLANNEWHTFTIVFVREESASSVKARVFLDGAKLDSATYNITQISNANPLTIGRIRSSGVNGSPVMHISQFMIFDRALSDQQIGNSYCRTELDEEHPGYNNILGLWRFDEMTGTRIKNRVNDNPNQDFVLSGLQSWEHFNSYASLLCPPVTEAYYKVVPFSVDAPLAVLQWMGVPLHAYRNLDGRAWPFNYSNLKAE